MPEQPGRNSRNCSVVCRVVLYGTYLLTTIIASLLFISLSFGHNPQAFDRLLICGVAFLYMAIAHYLLRHNHQGSAAYMLLLFYMFLAGGIVWTWGINTPLGVLLLGLVIVLAGILLAARHALIAATISGLVLIATQAAIIFNWHKPDTSWTNNASSLGDVLAYCTVFGMLALVSWLYNREMESSLAHARQAEADLLKQKATLEIQVKKRTAELRQSQLEEMRQMYRFAELGQLGVTLLHELANHLTALTMEIEGLKSKHHSEAITRARRIIHYLDKIVDSTRDRLRGGNRKQTFYIIHKTSETIAFLKYKATKANVEIDWQPPAGEWMYKGDSAGFCQIIAIITSNAIDATASAMKSSDPNPAKVAISMERNEKDITIRVSDWGKGISREKQRHLFKPFNTTKKSGMGLGLYIAKQTVETQFTGSLVVDRLSDHTEFVIKLPRTNGI